MRKTLPRIITLIMISAFPLFLSACQDPVEIDFADICKVENNDLLVVTDGYFSLSSTLYCSDVSGELRCGLVFNSYPDGNLEFSIEVREGRIRNRMLHLKSGYLEEDLKIKTADGSYIGVGDHVKVTGTLLVTEDVCLMYVDKIEKFE